ncbi:transmembrane and ubiquitin-like domain-containing protein 1 [Ceratina calcarata]|uniref:Transmembrane and ubiquitin-like domain-containing protein 1 n=1 Tax=Ceratina calcarata TaxID=156304 RepID=A0AAJ7IV90_9HYME|nr:transmembrane and ubiquitin-like domain-containing protein 1 [Ceratina calcarata]XP_017877932.1 transmembrane and ubiquitin-like domain-containing protein 1 [Ceratina calcarata]XP_017877933.1 transmembrane and ubiquitin-like domain-containing protein 1 [Ceratina calcarata]XP_017877934.1 transmembrane and ubiquitin-like domain-containing protein 1 [Ceratina calcarata]XP_026668393.1 transmembrane and ubiquitin-like domain-containing protein 1 [Ceratina calcarata]XP_026668394.1 transmembrane a
MTLIEGVGDEVTDFFIIVIVLVVGWLAWYSTSITEDHPLIRTVLVVHRTRTRLAETYRAIHQNASSFSRPPNLEVTEDEETIADDNSGGNSQNSSDSSAADANGGITPETNGTPEAAATEQVLIEAMDSFNNDNATLLQKQTKINPSKETTISSSTCNEPPEQKVENDANKISIKLKFINDDQKLVTGSLKEFLGDFKRRHFQTELNAQKLVRLVFNGRVLQPDNQTLEKCGMFNNCVVHCLVHQPRQNPAPSSASTLDNSSPIYFNPQAFSDIPVGTELSSVHNDWDLSRPLVIIVTLILSLAWYFRYHCAQFFTTSATVALYAITVIFGLSITLMVYQ